MLPLTVSSRARRACFLYNMERTGGTSVKSRHFVIVAAVFLLAQTLFAGDVVYTMWEDDESDLWVRIQNDTDRGIRVQNILIVFYNEKGKRIGEANVPCKGDCRLSSGDTRDFGPYNPPPNTGSARVRNVNYSVE
jgi:hypothetical protein